MACGVTCARRCFIAHSAACTGRFIACMHAPRIALHRGLLGASVCAAHRCLSCSAAIAAIVARCMCRAVLKRCHHHVRELEGDQSDDEEGEDLCDCDFSLAYGGRILLSGAKLRLKRGGRYGLCGPNGVGKTTLMKAIANGQVRACALCARYASCSGGRFEDMLTLPLGAASFCAR